VQTRQLIGSLLVALLIVAITFTFVVARLTSSGVAPREGKGYEKRSEEDNSGKGSTTGEWRIRLA
jgi:hypothetical protein